MEVNVWLGASTKQRTGVSNRSELVAETLAYPKTIAGGVG
jgi:hypothetical protein